MIVHTLTHTALLQRHDTRRKMDEWREAQKQRLENADTALEAASARLQEKAADIWSHVSILQHWIDNQQQSHDSNGALSAGKLSWNSGISAAAHADVLQGCVRHRLYSSTHVYLRDMQ